MTVWILQILQVPYGERVERYPIRDEAHAWLLGIFRHELVPRLQALEKATGNLKPHLKRVKHSALGCLVHVFLFGVTDENKNNIDAEYPCTGVENQTGKVTGVETN